MVINLNWKEFVPTKPPKEDEETGDTINEHELFCLWALYQIQVVGIDLSEEPNVNIEQTAATIQYLSTVTIDAPLFEDVDYVDFCLSNLELKGLVTMTTPRQNGYLH